MATPILRGSDEPQLQNWELSFDPSRGPTTTREFRGINLTKMQALANYYGVNRWSGTLRSEFGIATLKVSVPNASGGGGGTTSPVNDITDKWEIAVEAERPDLCENQYFKNYFLALDAAWATATGKDDAVSSQFFTVLRKTASGSQATLNGFAADLNSARLCDRYGVKVISGGGEVNLYTITLPVLYYVIHFVEDYFRGATAFGRSKYSLRHTTNAPDTFGPNVADFGVNKIYTIAQLLSECEDATLWVFPLPGYLAYKILSMPAPVSAPANYQFGALKQGSSAITTANNRVDIVTEYLIDSWPIHTYGTI